MKIRRLVGLDHRWALEGPISQRSAWADRETGARAKGVVHLFAARSRFQRLVGDFKSQYVFLLSHGYNSFRLPAAPAVRRSIRKPERPPSAMAYDPMQKLQSQLGKSLSLQLLMTVPRRISRSDSANRLQVGPLNFLQLLLGHRARLPLVQNSAQIQKPRRASRDAARASLTEYSVPAQI